MKTLRELKADYAEGRNITELLREERGLAHNSDEIIEIAYDLQAGSYQAAAVNVPHYSDYLERYTAEIARILRSLGPPASVLEAGVGEATTLAAVLRHLGEENQCQAYGFDLSWSRLACGQSWLAERGLGNTTLCTGNLFDIPFADNAVDIVYTAHSIEPNGGQESAILRELYRVAGRYLVLLEPAYELCSDEARERMEAHGYCKGIASTAEALGYRVLEHKLFEVTANPLNPTAITIIEKAAVDRIATHVLACPVFKSPLLQAKNVLYSPEALMAYPIVAGIACLRRNSGILASRFEDTLPVGNAFSSK